MFLEVRTEWQRIWANAHETRECL